MHIEGADQSFIFIDNQQCVEFTFFHDLQGFCCEQARCDQRTVAGHGLVDRCGMQINIVIQGAAQITIGEYTQDGVITGNNGGRAQALAGNFQQGVTDQRA